ncbi:DUF4232 domain-containing protein [Streptomyces glaucosporus]|uniref:DUF4232 domain-containing protein n=1 Tax=Streptomyces glaucosporus TaxID=284044 RepID=A0ABN3HPP3_9ACTN
MFRTRRMPRFAVAAALVAAASLSMTACQSGTGVETEERAPAESAPASPERTDPDGNVPEDRGDTPRQEPGNGGAGGGGATADPAGHRPSGDRKDGNDSAVTETCDASNTELTVRRVSRPVNHLLLTATNTGDTACNAYAYPYLRFDEAHAPVPAVESSRPQAVVTLAPGESAHAGITTSTAADSDVTDVTGLGVFFSDRDGGSVDAEPVRLALPDGTAVSPNARVTYWQSDLDDALMW